MAAGQFEELKSLLSATNPTQTTSYYFHGLPSLSSPNSSQTGVCCHSQVGVQFPCLRRSHPWLAQRWLGRPRIPWEMSSIASPILRCQPLTFYIRCDLSRKVVSSPATEFWAWWVMAFLVTSVRALICECVTLCCGCSRERY